MSNVLSLVMYDKAHIHIPVQCVCAQDRVLLLFSSLAGTAPCFTWSELEASMSLPWMEQIKRYMYLTILESNTRQAFETGKLLLFAIAGTCS